MTSISQAAPNGSSQHRPTTRDRIRQLVHEIEEKYKQSMRATADWDLESEERESQITHLRSQIAQQKEQRVLLEQLTNDLIRQNESLSGEIDQAELEQQSHMDQIQRTHRRVGQLRAARSELSKEQEFHQSSIMSANAMEEKNQAAKKQLELSQIAVQKLETEVEFSKERLQLTLKKLNSIESNSKQVRQVRDSLLVQKAAIDSQIHQLSLKNSTLNQSIQNMETSFVQMKQRSSALHGQQAVHQSHQSPLKSITLTVPANHSYTNNQMKSQINNSKSFLSDEIQPDDVQQMFFKPEPQPEVISIRKRAITTQQQQSQQQQLYSLQVTNNYPNNYYNTQAQSGKSEQQSRGQGVQQHKQQSNENKAQQQKPSAPQRKRTVSISGAIIGATMAVAAGVLIHRMVKK